MRCEACEVWETGSHNPMFQALEHHTSTVSRRPRTQDPTRHRPNYLVLSLGTSFHFVSYRSWDLPVFAPVEARLWLEL